MRLINATQEELNFTWSPPTKKCPYLSYNINAENCGICPNSTSLTSTTCRNFTLAKVCSFSVQSVICGSLFSNTPSNLVTANLNGRLYLSVNCKNLAIKKKNVITQHLRHQPFWKVYLSILRVIKDC